MRRSPRVEECDMNGMYRQGDVLLRRREPLGPRHWHTAIERLDDRLILALGEATGHAHAILDREAALLTDWNSRFLRVIGESVALVHEEHAPITIPKGFYDVIIQREHRYDQAAPRRVVD